MTDKPFTQPLILIWGAGEESTDKIGSKNLYDKRLDIKQSLEDYYKKQGKDVVVAFSENEILKQFTDNLKKHGVKDIHPPETVQVKWSSLIICLDDPRLLLTIQSEITGILLPWLTYPWRKRPEFLEKVVIFEPECFLRAEAGQIETAGSVASGNILEVRERLQELIELRPYTDEEFEQCELRNEVIRIVEALKIQDEIKDLEIFE